MAWTAKNNPYGRNTSSGIVTDVNNLSNPNNITSKDIKQKEVPGTFKFNPAMEQRILAAKDRQAMRVEKRRQNLVVGGGDGVKSQFTPTAEEGSKLYEKNLATQNRLNKVDSPKLNKKSVQPVSTGGSTITNSKINNTPASAISNISGAASIKPQAIIKNPPASSGSYTLSSTKDKPISGTDYYTAHALNAEDDNFNTIAKQVGNKDELSTNYARALDIKDEKKKDEAIGQAQKEDEAIFNLLFSKPSIKL